MCLTPIKREIYNSLGELERVVSVPCGHCWECLAERRRQWTHRLYWENFFSLSSFFLTLTYDEKHVPQEGVNKRDCQLFLKRFRKKLGKLRYFLVSEYGDTFGRPHYHMLVFFQKKIDMPDMVRATEECWKLGFIKVGFVTIQSIQYCSKYCLKERRDFDLSLDPDSGEIVDRNKTFALMSRKPGIGSQLLTIPKWLKDHTAGDGCFKDVVLDKVVNLPRYYRDKIMSDTQKLKHNATIAQRHAGKGLDSFDQQARGNAFLHSYNRRPSR